MFLTEGIIDCKFFGKVVPLFVTSYCRVLFKTLVCGLLYCIMDMQSDFSYPQSKFGFIILTDYFIT